MILPKLYYYGYQDHKPTSKIQSPTSIIQQLQFMIFSSKMLYHIYNFLAIVSITTAFIAPGGRSSSRTTIQEMHKNLHESTATTIPQKKIFNQFRLCVVRIIVVFNVHAFQICTGVTVLSVLQPQWQPAVIISVFFLCLQNGTPWYQFGFSC